MSRYPQPISHKLVDTLWAAAPRLLGGDDRQGSALAGQIRALSDAYNRRSAQAFEGATSPAQSHAARLRFFLPRDLPKYQLPLYELDRAGALPSGRAWSILDIGAGMGTATFAASAFARDRALAPSCEVVAVETDVGALDVMQGLTEELQRAGHILPTTVRTEQVSWQEVDMVRVDPRGFDLIIFGLVLNETPGSEDERLAQIESFAQRYLAPSGSLIIVEPALRSFSRALQRMRDRLSESPGGVSVFAPCPHHRACPLLVRERDWCHDQLLLPLPEPLASLASESGLRRERLTFAYLTLRADGQNLAAALGEGRPLQRVVGGPRETKGKTEWDLCGPEGLTRLRLLDRERSTHNEPLVDAARGSLLRLERTGADQRVGPDVSVERVLR